MRVILLPLLLLLLLLLLRLLLLLPLLLLLLLLSVETILSAYTRPRTHARTHARTHTRTHARTHAHTHTHTHARVYTDYIKLNTRLKRTTNRLETEELRHQGGTETWQVYCFGNRNVLRFDLKSPERVSVGEEGEGHSMRRV